MSQMYRHTRAMMELQLTMEKQLLRQLTNRRKEMVEEIGRLDPQIVEIESAIEKGEAILKELEAEHGKE